jgi:hypothetical protein
MSDPVSRLQRRAVVLLCVLWPLIAVNGIGTVLLWDYRPAGERTARADRGGLGCGARTLRAILAGGGVAGGGPARVLEEVRGMPIGTPNPATVRKYQVAIDELRLWCEGAGSWFPPTQDVYAQYLERLWAVRSYAVALPALAAMGWWCRNHDIQFDTKFGPLSRVVARIRDEERGRRVRRGLKPSRSGPQGDLDLEAAPLAAKPRR